MYSGVYERFFLFGVKRVILSLPSYSKFNLMKKNYPYIDKEVFPALGNGYLFFYEEDLKEQIYEEYLKPNKDIKRPSPEYDRLIGTVLGYPPKAVEFFSSGEHLKYPEKKICIRYCGVECVANIDDMVEDITWLWEKYPYPDLDILAVSHERSHVDISYGDIDRVRELRDIAKAYIEQIKKNGETGPSNTIYIGAPT